MNKYLDIDELFGYADDLGLVYIIDNENIDWVIDHINQDFIKLEKWAAEWCVTFVADKTQAMVISRKISPFDASGLRFGGEDVEMVDEMKLVGFVFDKKMTLEPVVKRSSKKGRAKIAALYRLKPYVRFKHDLGGESGKACHGMCFGPPHPKSPAHPALHPPRVTDLPKSLQRLRRASLTTRRSIP